MSRVALLGRFGSLALRRYVSPRSICGAVGFVHTRRGLSAAAEPLRPPSSSSPVVMEPPGKRSEATEPQKNSNVPSSSPANVLPPLSAAQEAAVAAHRDAVDAIRLAVTSVSRVLHSDVELLRAQLERLDDGLFLLVVVGEYNSGKSSCINALLGRSILEEGVVPTTAEVTVLRYSPATGKNENGRFASTGSMDKGVMMQSQNIELLKTVSLVDSPGTNAIDRRHEALTKEYLPMCDLVLFVTSADRPFSESERLFLQSIRAWGKKCILLINKSDLLPSVDAKKEVVQFVKSSSRALLGSSPQVFAVSSRQALEAKLSSTGASGPHWDASGFGELESFIGQSLNAEERLRIKLESVSSVAATVAKSYVERLSAESAILEADEAALAAVGELVLRCRASVDRGFPAHFARVDNCLLELVDRADAFFDSHVTLGNISILMKKDAIATTFMDQVVRDVERDVERRARNLAEWVSDKLTRNMADVASIFSRRVGERRAELAAVHKSSTHGLTAAASDATPGGALDAADMSIDADARLRFPATDVTEQLMSGLGDAAAQMTAAYRPDEEGRKVADAVAGSVRSALALELGAAATLGTLGSTAALDASGIAVAVTLAAGGLVVVPRRRRALRNEMRLRVESLRTRLERELHTRVVEQMALHAERIQVAVEPFSAHAKARTSANESQSKVLVAAARELSKVRERTSQAERRASSILPQAPHLTHRNTV